MRRSLAALALAVVLPGGALLSPAARADVVVKPGETLSEIADRHGVSLNRLMQANGISNPNMVVAGTRLVIPGSRSTAGTSGRGSGSGADAMCARTNTNTHTHKARGKGLG
jgi:LysM repeat protein